jgi:hypothetical protein
MNLITALKRLLTTNKPTIQPPTGKLELIQHTGPTRMISSLHITYPHQYSLQSTVIFATDHMPPVKIDSYQIFLN